MVKSLKKALHGCIRNAVPEQTSHSSADLKDLLVHICLECSIVSNYSLPFPERITSPACCLQFEELPRRPHTSPPGDIGPGRVLEPPRRPATTRRQVHLGRGGSQQAGTQPSLGEAAVTRSPVNRGSGTRYAEPRACPPPGNGGSLWGSSRAWGRRGRQTEISAHFPKAPSAFLPLEDKPPPETPV